jgi:hypothetical protein
LALVLGGQPGVAAALAGTLPASAALPPPSAAPPPPATDIPPPAASPTPAVSPTPLAATQSITPTPGADEFVIVEQAAFCDPALTPGLMTVIVQDADGEGLPGVEVGVSWADGQDNFFSGLKPEQGPGYADFVMTEGRVYSVRLVEGNAPLSERSGQVQAGQCTPEDGDGPQLEGYRVVFRRSGS